MTISDFVNYLNNSFKEDRTGKHFYTKEGVGYKLKEAIVEKPDKFVNEIDSFLECEYIYIYYLLAGINDGFKNNKNFDLKKYLSFTKN